jgi:hypothetical protein
VWWNDRIGMFFGYGSLPFGRFNLLTVLSAGDALPACGQPMIPADEQSRTGEGLTG